MRVPTPVTEIETRVVQTSSRAAIPMSASWPHAQQAPQQHQAPPPSYRSGPYPAMEPFHGGQAYPPPSSRAPSSYPSGTAASRVLVSPGPTPTGATPGIYIVASVLFLAIAAAGFGVWLAFEVISL
jgi:hypothetical protein